MSNTFKTAKGTVLPLINLKGKDYLEVKYRVIWFREEHPDFAIETEVMQHTDQHSVMWARIRDANGRILATGIKREDAKHFADHLEKSETGAIGRAIALCGYGTQFAQEMEEGDRIVDAPIPPKRPDSSTAHFVQPGSQSPNRPPKTLPTPGQAVQKADAHLFGHASYDWIIPKGKFEGKRLGNLTPGHRAKVAEFFNQGGDPKGWCKDFVNHHDILLAFESGGETGFAQTPPDWAQTDPHEVPF